MARLTGGVERLSVDGLFTDRGHAAGRRPLGAWLVGVALLLLLLEVLMRRLGWQWPAVRWPRLRQANARKHATSSTPAHAPVESAPVGPATPEVLVPEKRSALEIARDRARRRLR